MSKLYVENSPLEQSLQEDLIHLCHEMSLSCKANGHKYYPHRLRNKLSSCSALSVIKSSIGGRLKKGFSDLELGKSIHCSIEAFLFRPENEKYLHLFSEEELANAKLRLEEMYNRSQK